MVLPVAEFVCDNMQCLHPVIIRNPHRDTGLLPGEYSMIEVPCGRCIACRINKTRDWQVRLLMESFYWDNMSFVTLTYSPECVPVDFSVHKRCLQLFFKRLRWNLGDREIRYFASGEYGDMFGRPHYHAIIFGLDPLRDRMIVEDSWHDQGIVHFGSVTSKSIRYTCKYVQKKLGGLKGDEFYQGREKEFCVCSQHLGDDYMIEYQDKLKKDGYFQFQGKKYPLPLRFKNKFMSRFDKYEKMLDNRERYKAMPDIPIEVRERRILNMINRYAKPEYQIHFDPYWFNKE